MPDQPAPNLEEARQLWDRAYELAKRKDYAHGSVFHAVADARDACRALLSEREAREELVESAVALADYWPSVNIEKNYSERMQRFLRAVRSLPATESAQADEYAKKVLRPEEYRERNRRLYGSESAQAEERIVPGLAGGFSQRTGTTREDMQRDTFRPLPTEEETPQPPDRNSGHPPEEVVEESV